MPCAYSQYLVDQSILRREKKNYIYIYIACQLFAITVLLTSKPYSSYIFTEYCLYFAISSSATEKNTSQTGDYYLSFFNVQSVQILPDPTKWL